MPRHLFRRLPCVAVIVGGLSALALAAVAEPTRPDQDVKRHADRTPADMLSVAGIRLGETGADRRQGGGDFTLLFSSAVGPDGVIYAFAPAAFATVARTSPPAKGGDADRGRSSLAFLTAPAIASKTSAPVDLIATAGTRQDLKYAFASPADATAVDAAVHAALAPGDAYVILDHVGLSGKWDPGSLAPKP